MTDHGTGTEQQPHDRNSASLLSLRDRQAQDASDRIASPTYFVYRCPVCFAQKRGPGGHSVAGGDMCQGIGPDGSFHTAKLERIEVVPR